MMRTPAMLEWATRHAADGCPHLLENPSSCPMCALFLTHTQVLGGFGQGRASIPAVYRNRNYLSGDFAVGQHDAFEYLEKFFDRAHDVECAAGRYAFWGGVQLVAPAATHLDRIFGFVRETRRRCRQCRGVVRSWFARERVLRLQPKVVPGGSMTVAEMYYDSCKPVEDDDHVDCLVCQACTPHESQSRVLTPPNVLVVQMRRIGGARPGVDAEESLDVPGLPLMDLAGVVYHNGQTFESGHYTCLCRGPGGRYWMCNDAWPVRRVESEVAHVKPKEVYMLVYCRSGGDADWKNGEGAEALNLDYGAGVGGEGAGHGAPMPEPRERFGVEPLSASARSLAGRRIAQKSANAEERAEALAGRAACCGCSDTRFVEPWGG